jgi:hypothetical protein
MKRKSYASGTEMDFSRSPSVRARVFDQFKLLAEAIKYAGSRHRSSRQNSSVIPGNPGEGRGDPESRKIANLDAGFRRHDDEKASELFCALLGRDTGSGCDELKRTIAMSRHGHAMAVKLSFSPSAFLIRVPLLSA